MGDLRVKIRTEEKGQENRDRIHKEAKGSRSKERRRRKKSQESVRNV